ncbi:MAG: flagellar filament capping protein FliD [Paracoccaceae bacterium]|nr:flagellar filament capping protein FliD [Paracoccaceae bacterium]
MAETELSTTSTAKPNVLSSVNKNGSGMDLAAVVTALVDAETVPQRVLTERAKETTETSISAYGTLKGKVSDLNTNLTSLEASSGRLPFSDNSKVFISVIDETLANDFVADITISQIATGQVLSYDLNTALNTTTAKASSTIDQGTYRIATTAWSTLTPSSYDVVINSTNNTVEGLKDALNEVTGVGAEIIDTGAGGVKLLIKSEAGTDNSLTITSTTGDTQFLSAKSSTATTASLSGLSSVKSGNDEMAAFGVAISGNVLTVSGEDTGGAGTLSFDLTTAGLEKLEISVDVLATDNRVDLITKIDTAIAAAVSSHTKVTTATTTVEAGILASGSGGPVSSTLTFDSLEEHDQRVVETRTAANAIMTIDGVTVTRSSNVIEDLYPGHQIVLTGTTAHENGQPTESFSFGSANTNSAAKTRFQDFISHINDLKIHLNEVTEKGILGGEAGALAGDTAAQTILRRLSGFTTQPIAGYGDDPIYLAEMGVRTMIDGTLELYDEDRFDAALAENPNVLDPIFNTKFSSSSSAFSMSGFDWDPPDVGSYDFSYTHDSAGGTATLTNGDQSPIAMVKSEKDGVYTFQSAATDTSDPTYGIRVTVLDPTGTTAKVRYGVSLLDTIKAYTTDLLGYANALDNKVTLADREVELQADITEADATLAEIEAKVTELTDRYNTQFSAMEAAVTGLNATGEYMETLFDSWNNQNN